MEEALKDLAEHGLDWFAPLSEPKKVELSLPKMDLESNESLMDALKALGMTVSSSDAADFSGMSQEPLYIADVRQAVRLQVDEEGTKAAAASTVRTQAADTDSTVFFFFPKKKPIRRTQYMARYTTKARCRLPQK